MSLIFEPTNTDTAAQNDVILPGFKSDIIGLSDFVLNESQNSINTPC